MEYVYVERDSIGAVVGVYANAQVGYATERIASNSEDVLRYTNPELFPTQEQIIADYEAALDSFLDSVALTYRYGVNGQIPPRYSLVVRTGFPSDDQQLAVAFGAWMDICNGIAKAKLNEVLAGHAEMPTKEEFLAMLPTFTYKEPQ